MKLPHCGWICAIWLLSTLDASASNPILPLRKPDPNAGVHVPWDDLNERNTSLIKKMMDNPTVQAKGPAETFSCTPDQYYWLLENPDRAVLAWRRLGAKCVSIQRRAPGKFGYVDDLGSDVAWETIHVGKGIRIWFAEGKVKASPVLPIVPVKALVLIHHAEGKMPDGNVVVQHHAEVVVHTDSKVAATATKLMGQSATKVAEQGLGQLQLFFSALSCYADRHPDRVEALFRPETPKDVEKR